MESELINEIICKKFIELNPDAIIYSVFDSLLVNHAYAPQLELMMQAEGSKFFGIECRVKAK